MVDELDGVDNEFDDEFAVDLSLVWHEVRVYVEEDVDLLDLVALLLLEHEHLVQDDVLVEICATMAKQWMRQLQQAQKSSSDLLSHLLKAKSCRLLSVLRQLAMDKEMLVMPCFSSNLVDMLILSLQLLNDTSPDLSFSSLSPSLSALETILRYMRRLRLHCRRRSRPDSSSSSSEDSSESEILRRPSMHVVAHNPLDFDYFEQAMNSDDEAKFVIEWRRSRKINATRLESFSPLVLKCLKRVRSQLEAKIESKDESSNVTEAFFFSEVSQLLFHTAKFYVQQRQMGRFDHLDLQCKHLLSFATHQLSKSLGNSQVFSLAKIAFTCLAALQASHEASQVLNTELTVLGQKSIQLANKAVLEDDIGAKCVALQVATLIVASTTYFRYSQFKRLSKERVASSKNYFGVLESCYRDQNGFDLLETLIKATTTVDNVLDNTNKSYFLKSEFVSSLLIFYTRLCSFLRVVSRQEDSELQSRGVKCSLLMMQVLAALATRLENKRDKDQDALITLFKHILHQLRSLTSIYTSKRLLSVDFVWESWLKVASNCCSNLDMVKLVFNAVEHVLENNEQDCDHSNLIKDGFFSKRLNSEYDESEDETRGSDGHSNKLQRGSRTRRSQRHRKRELNRFNSNELALMSDSDSAFCASDVSLTPIDTTSNLGKTTKEKKKNRPLSSRSFLMLYVDLLTTKDATFELRESILTHLWRVIEMHKYSSQLLTQVTLPLLEDNAPKLIKEVSKELNDDESQNGIQIQIVSNCLRVLLYCLRDISLLPILRGCGLMSLLTLTLKSSSLLTEASFAVMESYLRAELESVLHHDNSSGLLPALIDAKEESSDELERHLTDEQIFQPTLMKALSLTTLMKTFHQLLVAKTAQVLDLKSPNQSVMESSLRQLHWAWHTEASLVVQFDEFLDYGHTKGLSRMMETLLDHLLDLPQNKDVPWKLVLPVISDLLVILVQQVRCEARLSDVADSRQILMQTLNKLATATMAEMDDIDDLRAIVLAMLKAAVRYDHPNHKRTAIKQYSESGNGYEADIDDDNSTNDQSFNDDDNDCDTPCLASTEVALFSLRFSLDLLRQSKVQQCVASEVLELCLYRFRRSCEDSNNILTLFATNKALNELLLSHFDLLIAQENDFVINEAISLLSMLFKKHLSRDDFRRIIELFKREDSRRMSKHLLTLISSVASESTNDEVMPKHHFSFPAQADVVAAIDNDDDNRILKAAVFDVSKEGFGTLNNALITFWLRNFVNFSKRSAIQQAFNKVHLLSLPMGPRRLEIWASADSNLLLRLCRNDSHIDNLNLNSDYNSSSETKILSSASFTLSKHSKSQEWHHLCLRLKSSSEGLHVTLIMDGERVDQQHVVISKEEQMRASTTKDLQQLIHVGHTWSQLLNYSCLNVELASLAVFNESNLEISDNSVKDEDIALFLALLGPDFDLTTLSTYQDEDQHLLLTRHMLRLWPQLSSRIGSVIIKSQGILQHLRGSIKASMQASRPAKLFLHHFSSSTCLRPKSGKQTLLSSLTCTPKFHSLISDEGGVSALVLLIARMVELRVDDETLAISLDILFTSICSSSQLMSEFRGSNNLEVLAKILGDSRSNMGIHCTTSIINAMLTEPIISGDHGYGRLAFNVDHNTLEDTFLDEKKARNTKPHFIHLPCLLDLLLLLWKKMDAPIEPRHRQTLLCNTSLEVFLYALSALVDADISVSKSNVEVMNRLQLAKRVVYKIIEDASFQDKKEYKKDDISNEQSGDKTRMELLVQCSSTLFASLLGSPADLELVDQAMGLVMLAHGVQRNHVAAGEPLVNLEENNEDKKDDDDNDDDFDEDENDVQVSAPNLMEHPWPWGETPTSSPDLAEDELLSLKSSEQILAKLTSSLLHILTNVLRTMADLSLQEALNKIFLPEHLIVLCNHPWSRIRAQSLTLLSVYVHRSRSMHPLGLRMGELQAYYLIRNQLEKHKVTEDIVNACLNLLHGSNPNFIMTAITHDRLSLIGNCVLRQTQMNSLLPIMGLIPRLIGLKHMRMIHHVLVHLHDICAKSTNVLLNHRQLGLFEHLAAVMRAVCKLQERTDKTTEETVKNRLNKDVNVILQDIFDFLRLLALRFVSLQGNDNLKQIDELLHLLLALSQLAPNPSRERSVLREATCVVLEECLIDIESSLGHIQRLKLRAKPTFASYSTLVGVQRVEEKRERIFGQSDTLDDDQGSLPTSFIDHDNEFGNEHFWGQHDKMAGKTELRRRLDFLADFAVSFLIHNDARNNNDNDEENEHRLFDSLLTLLTTHFVPRGSSTLSSMSSLSSLPSMPPAPVALLPSNSSENKCARHLWTLINFGLNPKHKLKSRLNFAHSLLHDHVTLLDRLCARKSAAPMQRHAFALLLSDLIQSQREDAAVKAELKMLRQVALSNEKFKDEDKEGFESSLKHEMDELSFANHKASGAFRQACLLRARKELKSRNELAQRSTTSSKSSSHQISRIALRRQEVELRSFMSGVRASLMSVVRTLQQCSSLIEHHTHEASLWRFRDKEPQSWALSETEGTQRTRIRLERRWTNIGSKYYLNPSKEQELRSDDDEDWKPFGFLLRCPLGVSSALIEQLSSREHIKFMERVTFVRADAEIDGELLVGANALYFVEGDHVEQELTHSDQGSRGGRPLSLSWPLSSLRELHSRWYSLRDCAVELFFSNATTRFFVLSSRSKRQLFMQRLIECQPRLSLLPEPEQLMRSWQDGAISNFEYLMQLNKLAGRTFNDLMQYPVFPFVLADYTSETLDLFEERSFRNLRKPISVQNEEHEQRYKENYQVLAEELASKDNKPNALGVGPFHYGSHYSSSGIVLHFLVRLPPFTAMFLRYQDGNFDLPDRSFHSLDSTWRLASSESSSDVKELIPDLFTLPELLMNNEDYDMGLRQNGERVNHVQLPPWAKNDARLFIKIHRQALESDWVRETLNYWIDLVFGFKQQGKEAVNAINVFHPATYYGFDLNSIEDPVLREARATMIKTYGQTPKQLFRVPHPMITKKWRQSRRRREQINAATFASTLTGDAEKPLFIPRVLDSVIGLRWGNYVGSPSQPEPSVVLRRMEQNHVAKLVALPNNEVYGLAPKSALVAHLSLSQESVTAAALVTCASDGHVRVHVRRHLPPSMLCTIDAADKLVCMAVDNADRLFLGMTSGKILVQPFLFKTKELSLRPQADSTQVLYGHRGRIRQILVLPAHNLLLSGSDDGSIIMWDLATLVLIRQVRLEGQVAVMGASRTSGDVAVVVRHQLDNHEDFAYSDYNENGENDEDYNKDLDENLRLGNVLRVLTINGVMVGKRRCEPLVRSVSYSCAPEGVSVNVIVTGHTHGVIRLWNSWDLSVVRELATNQSQPIVDLAFSWDNQNLFVVTGDDELIVYEKADIHGLSSRLPKFVNVSNAQTIRK